MVDLNKVAVATNQMNASNGIKVVELAKILGMVPGQETNRLISKALSDLGWSRSKERFKSSGERFYLWFSPATSTLSVATNDYELLKAERAQFLKERNELQKQLEKTKIELDQYKSRMNEDLEKMRTDAMNDVYTPTKSDLTIKDFRKSLTVTDDEDAFDEAIRRSLTRV